MRPDDRPDVAHQAQKPGRLFSKASFRRGIFGAVGVAHNSDMGLPGVVHVLLVVLRQLLDALLAASGHADQRQRPILSDDRAAASRPGRRRPRQRKRGCGPATQGLRVVHHELLVHENSGPPRPKRPARRPTCPSRAAPAPRRRAALGHAGQMGVHDVQLEVRVLGENLVAHDAGGVERGGQPAGERQVPPPASLSGRRRERVGERLQRHLGRRGLRALAHGPVEGLGRHGLEQVVLEGAPSTV